MSRHGIPARSNAIAISTVRTLLLGGLLTCMASTSMAAEKVLDRTFTVKPGGTLTVTADGARISVSGADSNQVVVHMAIRSSQDDLEDVKLEATQNGDSVDVEMRIHRLDWSNWRTQAQESSIEVTVPRNYHVETRTSGGDVRLENFAGPSRVRTSGGDIVARNLKGDLDGQTSGGDVRLESLEGLVKVHTSGGDIHAEGVRGEIKADTSGGDVRLLGIDGRIRANSSGGGIQCELVGTNRGISASTSGGGIRLTMPKGTTGTLNAESNGGEVSSDFPVSTMHWERHRLNGLINGGGAEINVHASGGGITLSARD